MIFNCFCNKIFVNLIECNIEYLITKGPRTRERPTQEIYVNLVYVLFGFLILKPIKYIMYK